MEISGKIKKIFETKIFTSGFRKRELVILTNNRYPQPILVEFFQDKIEILDSLKINDFIKISINIRGREWINSEGIIKYLNYIQGWRIEKLNNNTTFPKVSLCEDLDYLPF